MALHIESSLHSECEHVREAIITEKLDDVKENIVQFEKWVEEGDLSVEENFQVCSILGKFYRKRKNYDKSGKYSRKAIRLTKEIHEIPLQFIIDTYLDYAHLELEYGQASNARIELAKLLALLDSRQYQDSYTYGVVFSSLAKVSLKEENLDSGIKQYEKALNYYRQSFPETHPILSATIYNLSNLYIQIEDYHQALHLHEGLLAAYQTEKNKLFIARELIRIGEVYFYIDLKKARRTVTNAIKMLTETEEENLQDMSKAILMLAEIDENVGNYPRAINYYKQALDPLLKMHKEDHFLIVYVYSKIGTISIRTFKIGQAKDYLEKGLHLSKPYAKIRMQFLYALGKIYSDEERYGEAFNMFQEFLHHLEKEGRKNSVAYGNALQSIAFNEIKQVNIEKAYAYYQEALAIYEKLTNCKEEKGLTYIRLAYCYENSNVPDKIKAEDCYEKGYRIIEKTRNGELLEEALAGIIEFFTRNDQPKKRKIYENKLVKILNSK